MGMRDFLRMIRSFSKNHRAQRELYFRSTRAQGARHIHMRRINLIDKHIAWREQTQRLAGRFEEDRYSRVRSINKTANAHPYGGVMYLERCRGSCVPYIVRY